MNEVAKRIAGEIAIHGAISFAQFMELALHCPIFGYYEKKKDTPGKRGDFITSVSIGRLFGELLAYQFAEWLAQLPVTPASAQPKGTDVQIVEAGAHDGILARDILTWIRESRPTLFQRLEYWIIEPSARRQQWQLATLQEFSGKVAWAATLQQMRTQAKTSGPQSAPEDSEFGVRGVIFSNELLDSMPVQRWGWDARTREWFEWGVAMNEERFTWTRLNHSRLRSPEFMRGSDISWPSKLLPFLPDGFVREFSPSALEWWHSAARLLQSGKLLTIDYGLSEEELLRPERGEGTLRAYQRHVVSRDILAFPGEQDITAHVNFTAIQRAGESAGLRTTQFVSQEQFLMNILSRFEKDGLAVGNRLADQKRQILTLTSPEHLGRFRVLVQESTGHETLSTM